MDFTVVTVVVVVDGVELGWLKMILWSGDGFKTMPGLPRYAPYAGMRTVANKDMKIII